MRPEAVGICGSDFHLFSGDVGALSGARDFFPRVQGHEVSALVEDVGDPGDAGNTDAGDGRGVKEGDRVAIWPLLPCGHCYPCRVGRPNVCIKFRLVGVHLDGGLAERLEVPAGLVFGVGDLDPDSASFVEPASVAVHALARARLQPGEQVVVFGAGPIGLATLVAAVSQGARVLSVDPLASRRDLAKRLGAEAVTWAPEAELKGTSTRLDQRRGAAARGRDQRRGRRPAAGGRDWCRRPAGSWSSACRPARCPSGRAPSRKRK